MSEVEIYDTSSSSSLESNEYSNDEEDDDLMDAAVSSKLSYSVGAKRAEKPTTSLQSTQAKRSSNILENSLIERQQTNRNKFLLKQKRIHTIYKEKSIKYLNGKPKRLEARKLLKNRILLQRQVRSAWLRAREQLNDIYANLEADKISLNQDQKRPSAAEKSVEHSTKQQQRDGGFKLKDNTDAYTREQKEEMGQNNYERQRSPSLELVCLDDTENELTPFKENSSYDENNTAVKNMYKSSSAQPEAIVKSVENKVETEVKKYMPTTDSSPKGFFYGRAIGMAAVKRRLSSPIEKENTKVLVYDVDNDKTEVKIINNCETSKLEKFSAQPQYVMQNTVMPIEQKTSPDIETNFKNNVETSTPIQIKRQRSPTPESNALKIRYVESISQLPPTPQPPMQQPSSSKQKRDQESQIFAHEFKPEQVPKTTQTCTSLAELNNDPNSNAVFYQKIKSMFPDYNESMYKMMYTKNPTTQAINEKIASLNFELSTLEESLRKKEDEWNRLQYMRRIKQELLERLLHKRKMLQNNEKLGYLKDCNLLELRELDELFKKNETSENRSIPMGEDNIIHNLIHYLQKIRKDDGRSKFDEQQQQQQELKSRASGLNALKNVDNDELNDFNAASHNDDEAMPHLNRNSMPSQFENSARASSPVMGVGRQGQFKNVKSIIEDYRRQNPDNSPPEVRRFKYAQPAPKQQTMVLDDVPTLQKLLHNALIQPAMSQSQSHIGGTSSWPNSLQSRRSEPDFLMKQQMRHQRNPPPPLQHSHQRQMQQQHHQRQRASMQQYQSRSRNEDADLIGIPIYDSLNSHNANRATMNSDSQLRSFLNEFNDYTATNGHEKYICQYCFKDEARYMCAGCSGQRYCSRECQLEAWDKHSVQCTK